jgi:hypothetical protein
MGNIIKGGVMSRASHKAVFTFGPWKNRVCTLCGQKEFMSRIHKKTGTMDERRQKCFQCVPNMDYYYNVYWEGPDGTPHTRNTDHTTEVFSISPFSKSRDE